MEAARLGRGRNKNVSTDWRTVAHGQNVDVPFCPVCVDATSRDIDIAIWWSVTDCRNSNIDLQLLDPSGRIVATSSQPTSVWEKLRVSGPLIAGSYTIRMIGTNVAASQQVFYSRLHRY